MLVLLGGVPHLERRPVDGLLSGTAWLGQRVGRMLGGKSGGVGLLVLGGCETVDLELVLAVLVSVVRGALVGILILLDHGSSRRVLGRRRTLLLIPVCHLGVGHLGGVLHLVLHLGLLLSGPLIPGVRVFELDDHAVVEERRVIAEAINELVVVQWRLALLRRLIACLLSPGDGTLLDFLSCVEQPVSDRVARRLRGGVGSELVCGLHQLRRQVLLPRHLALQRLDLLGQLLISSLRVLQLLIAPLELQVQLSFAFQHLFLRFDEGVDFLLPEVNITAQPGCLDVVVLLELLDL